MNRDIELGRLLGRREAFSIVAGRCTAADAALLRKFRDEKLYAEYAKDWDDFCTVYLKISRASANRLIALLDEFGPQYFEVAQLTHISPALYRLLAPSIRDGALHKDGEVIAMIPENADKFAAAAAELRPAVKREPAVVPVSSLREDCRALLRRFEGVHASGSDRLELRKTLTEMMEGLARIAFALPLE